MSERIRDKILPNSSKTIIIIKNGTQNKYEEEPEMRKRKRLNRIIAAFLSIILLSGLAGGDMQAASAKPASNDASYDTDMDTGIRAENTIGNLIKNTLEASQENGEAGYDIIDLSVEGNLAAVEYDTLEDAELVVAVYAEGQEPLQMLASGKAAARKDEHTVQVTIETDSMPQYFIVKAFLLQSASHSPLCGAYVSTLYTQEMQELQEKTTDDFDENRILNLDDDTTTNYAVFSADTELIDEQTGKNKVTDNKDGTYTVTNADTSFTGLKKGDVFSYNYEDGTVLVVKIAAIQINGSTVVITEDKDADLSDAFDYVKIEETDDGTNTTVDDSGLEESVTYEGEENAGQKRAIDVGGSIGKTFNFEIAKEKKSENGKVSAVGKVGLGVITNVNVYISLNYQYVETRIEFPTSVDVTITGKYEEQFKLASLTISPVAGLYIRITPSVRVRASGQIEYHAKITMVIGFAYDSKKGMQSKCSAPRVIKNDFSAEASLYLGFVLTPNIAIVSENLVNASLSAETGIQADASLRGGEKDDSKLHRCSRCIEGTLTAKVNAAGEVNIANKWNKKATLLSMSKKIADFYYSIDNSKFAFTKCPNFSYRVVVRVKNAENNSPIANATVGGTGLANAPVTDINGQAAFYLPAGQYNLEVSNGDYTGTAQVWLDKKAKTVNIDMAKNVPTSGTAGPNITWELKNGTLYIQGTGAMDNYSYSELSSRPWDPYKNKIKSVMIKKGITKIGKYAFYECENLSSVSIPDSVHSISDSVFSGCTSLNNILLPNTINFIEDAAFEGCTSLDNIVIPDNVDYIGSYAFHGCSSLSSIVIPKGVTSIEEATFCDCTNLNSIILPETLTSLGQYAFWNCTSLDNIIIPDNVVNIGANAFDNCTSLSSVLIPTGVTGILGGTFSGCTNLSKVTISDNVTFIGVEAFIGCESLNSIKIPASVTVIGSRSFWGCDNIREIYFQGDAPNYGDDASFYGSGDFDRTVYYPYNNSTWTNEVMQSLVLFNSVTWVAYDYSNNLSVSSTVEGDTQQNKEMNDDSSVEEYNMNETVINIPVQYYTYSEAPIFKTETYTIDASGFFTASFEDLTPKSEYLLAVVNDENAEDVLAADNLLYIDQKASDENGTITLSYMPKDAMSGSELFFGPGDAQKLSEFIAEILAAQADDIVQADEGAFSALPAAAMQAARIQQVNLEFPAGNRVFWEISGKTIPDGAERDMNLEAVRADGKNGKIPEQVMSEIVGKYDGEQVNISDVAAAYYVGASLKVGTDEAFNDWKCVVLQCSENGGNSLVKSTIVKNGEIYIDKVQDENYLLIYGKNGDVTGDKTVNMTDLMKTLHHVSGRSGLSTLEQAIADINLDNRTNMADLMKILHYVSGRNKEL